jgi:hypothetical protein
MALFMGRRSKHQSIIDLGARVRWVSSNLQSLWHSLMAPVLADWRSVCLSYIAADLRKSFLASLLAIHDQRFLFCPRYIRFSKWGILFEGGEVGLSMSMLCLLHCSFSRRILAMLRCPGHYGQCILCHCSTLTNIYTKYAEVSCQCRLVQ